MPPRVNLISQIETQQPAEPTVADPLAQRMELHARFSAYLKPEPHFKPGCFVVEKHGLSTMHEKVVKMFVRWLDPTSAIDIEMIKDEIKSSCNNTFDCMMMCVDGESTYFFVTDSGRYRVHPNQSHGG